MNTHKPQVCYKHVFNKFLLNSIRNKEQTKIKKTVSADYGYSNPIFVCLKYSYITLNIKKRKHIGVILAPFFACTIPVSWDYGSWKWSAIHADFSLALLNAWIACHGFPWHPQTNVQLFLFFVDRRFFWIPTNHRSVKIKFHKHPLNGVHEAEPDTWISHLFYN